MSFLRSSLFIAIVSLSVLAGYGYDLLGDCCRDGIAQQTECLKDAPNHKAPGVGNDCQCLCHQVISHLTSEPPRIARAIRVPTIFAREADEFPPDSVPVGIDHPPQLI